MPGHEKGRDKKNARRLCAIGANGTYVDGDAVGLADERTERRRDKWRYGGVGDAIGRSTGLITKHDSAAAG